MRTIGVMALTGLTVILTSCGSESPAVNKIALEKSINDVETDMRKVANARDAAAFASHFAADAVMMTPGQPPKRGPDEIQAGMKNLLSDPNFRIDFASDITDVADSGDMAATRGSYTLTVTDPASGKAREDKGSYVTVFRKQKDGAWKAVLDCDVSENPPPAKTNVVVKGKKARGKKR